MIITQILRLFLMGFLGYFMGFRLKRGEMTDWALGVANLRLCCVEI
ncbi:hypothetical protein JQ676_001497 [Campylobacter upsaliensis]|nr:hypothetical protein [Campylobacter upsaliensis]